jgi:hypothetical protein
MSQGGRGKNMTEGEMCQLCLSFLAISQDPCVGANQRKENLWQRITQHINEHKPPGQEARTERSLESKYGKIRKAVSKFVGCHQEVKKKYPSGTSAEDIIRLAKELYEVKHGESFQFELCWLVLK